MRSQTSFRLTPQKLQKVLTQAILIYGLVTMAVIAWLSVDIPHIDEWGWLTEEFFGRGFGGGRFWGFDNGHREIPTWTLAYASMKFLDMNFRVLLIFNLFVYAGLVWLTWKKVAAPAGPLGVILLLPLLSSLNFENHTMSEQNCIHFALIGFVAGSAFFYEATRPVQYFLAVTCFVFSFFSCASGIPGAIGAVPVYLLWVIKEKEKKKLSGSLWGTLALILATWVWFRGYPIENETLVMPWHPRFWHGMMEMVSFGYGQKKLGIDRVVFFTATAASLLWGIKVYFMSPNPKTRKRAAFLLSLAMGILAMMSSIVVGRVAEHYEHMKFSRYYEYAMFLPLLCGALVILDTKRPRLWGGIICFLMLAATVDKLGYRKYFQIHAVRVDSEECLRGLFTQPEKNPGYHCPGTFPNSLVNHIPFARKHRFGWAVRLSQPKPE